MTNEVLDIGEEVRKIIRTELQQFLQDNYVTIEQHEQDLKNLREELLGIRSVKLPTLNGVQEYKVMPMEFDPKVHNTPGVVYIDPEFMAYIDGKPIGKIPSVVEFSDTLQQSIEDAKQVEEDVKSKNESLEEFTPEDLNAYSMKAFGTPAGWVHMQPKPNNGLGQPVIQTPKPNPTAEENRSKWDAIANSLMKSWDDIGGNNGQS